MNDDLLLEIRDRIRKMESYLYNDDDTGKDGIVKEHEKLNKRVSTLEEKEKIEKAKSATWGVIGGSIVIGLIRVLEHILK